MLPSLGLVLADSFVRKKEMNYDDNKFRHLQIFKYMVMLVFILFIVIIIVMSFKIIQPLSIPDFANPESLLRWTNLFVYGIVLIPLGIDIYICNRFMKGSRRYRSFDRSRKIMKLKCERDRSIRCKIDYPPINDTQHKSYGVHGTFSYLIHNHLARMNDIAEMEKLMEYNKGNTIQASLQTLLTLFLALSVFIISGNFSLYRISFFIFVPFIFSFITCLVYTWGIGHYVADKIYCQ